MAGAASSAHPTIDVSVVQAFEHLEKFRLRENAACDEDLAETPTFVRLYIEGNADLVTGGQALGHEEVAQPEAETAARELVGDRLEDFTRGRRAQLNEDLAQALAEFALALHLQGVVEQLGRDESLVDE